MNEVSDLSFAIEPKSDQLNADDLIAGPLTVTVAGVKRGNVEQPVELELEGGLRPYKPCKSMMRVLVSSWGKDGNEWVGRSMTLYRDPEVKWAGKAVGGIRISHLTHIKKPVVIMLTVTRGKREPHRVSVLAYNERVTLEHVLSMNDLTPQEVDVWRLSIGKGPLSELMGDQQSTLAEWLAADPSRIDAVRAAAKVDEPLDADAWEDAREGE